MGFNMGGGFPVANITQGDLGDYPNTTDLDAHPDWWSSTGSAINGVNTAATFGGMVAGTISSGDTFSITLTSGSTAQTVTVTATSSDNTPSGIVSALVTAIDASSLSYFKSTNITTATDSSADIWSSSTNTWVLNTPVVEIYPTGSTGSYTATAATSGSANFKANVTNIVSTGVGELNFTNPAVINEVINGFVANWVSGNPAPGSMLSMSPPDGGNYDQSASTKYLMHSNSPYQDTQLDWWGYNQNGILVAADSESYWALVNDAAQYILKNEAAGANLSVGALAYEAVTQPPSFPLDPNVYVEVTEGYYAHTSLTTEQLLKGFAQKGALTGVYKFWTVYDFAGQDGEPAPPDLATSAVEADWNIYNNDHVTGIGGESNSNFGPGGLGYYLADTLNDNASLGSSTNLQNILTNFYSKSFGPAATSMEDYFVMFNGISADPNLSSPPAQVSFNGNAVTINSLSQAATAVANDKSILKEAYGYFGQADTALTTAYNSGHNGSFTTAQYAADQSRVDQLRMYMVYLFDQYQVELDYNNEGYTNSNLPPKTSPYFNTLLNDLTNETVWADSLAFTQEVDTEAYVTWFAGTGVYADLNAIWSNDPAGSNGLANGHGAGATHGLLQDPSPTASIDGGAVLINNSPTQTLLNSAWTTDDLALGLGSLSAPSGLTATEVNGSNRAQSIDLTWTDNDGGAATAYDIDRSTTSTGGFAQIGTAGAGATAYTDSSVFPSTTYYYEVDAVDSSSTSAFSNIAHAAVPTNEVGGVVTDYWFGSNGSAWSTQWTKTDNITNATTTSVAIENDQGQEQFIRTTGGGLGGQYLANINTQSIVDSFQSVVVTGSANTGYVELVARTAATSNSTSYFVQLLWGAGGRNLTIEKDVAGTITTIASGSTLGGISTASTYDLEFEVLTANSTTTDLSAKFWATSGTEPTTWSVSTSDTTSSLQGHSGDTGLVGAGETTNITYTFDNYEAVNIASSNASYIDNFQNSSTTGWSPLTASRWSVGTNGASIRYYINTSSYTAGSGGSLGEYSLLNASGYTNVGDFTMTVDVAAGSSTAGSNYAIVFGYQNSTNYYFMEFNAISGDTALYKVVSGTASVVTSASGSWITDTAYHAIKIQRTGTSITVWYDGDQVLTTTDATFIGGQIGLGALNDATYFDNVIIG